MSDEPLTVRGFPSQAPEEAIGAWHKEAAARRVVPVGKVEVDVDRQGIPTATGRVRPLAEIQDSADIDNWFTYHAPTPEQIPAYEAVRDAGRTLAYVIAVQVPPGPDRSAAYRKVREAVMTANAGIACARPEPPAPAAVDVAANCASTYTIPPGMEGTIVTRYRCTKPLGHRSVHAQEDSRTPSAEWADEESDKRQGRCTTCGHQTRPHPFDHPVTTGLQGLRTETRLS